MIDLLIYFLPLALSLLIIHNNLTTFYSKFLEAQRNKIPNEDFKNEILHNMTQDDKLNVPLEELKKEKTYFIEPFIFVLETFRFFFIFPIFVFKFSIILRFGIRHEWRIPFDYYDIWSMIFIVVSFHNACLGANYLSFFQLFMVFNLYFLGLLEDLKITNGKIGLLSTKTHKIHLHHIVSTVLFIILSFSSLFHLISQIDPKAFSCKLSIISSIYFSIVSFATVGYGDITPTSDLARIAVSLEILIGMFVILGYLVIYVGYWAKLQIDKQNY